MSFRTDIQFDNLEDLSVLSGEVEVVKYRSALDSVNTLYKGVVMPVLGAAQVHDHDYDLDTDLTDSNCDYNALTGYREQTREQPDSARLYADFAYYKQDANYAAGSYTGYVSGPVAFTMAGAVLLGNTPADVSWYAATTDNLAETGSIRIRVKPWYSGTPTSNQYFVVFEASGSENSGRIELRHSVTSGNLLAILYDDNGTDYASATLASWSPVLGTQYEISVEFDLAADRFDLYVGGSRVAVGTVTASITRTPLTSGFISLGRPSNFEANYPANFMVAEVLISDEELATGATYTPSITTLAPTHAYAEATLDFGLVDLVAESASGVVHRLEEIDIDLEYNGVGVLTGYAGEGPLLLVGGTDEYLYSGESWVHNTGTPIQYAPIATAVAQVSDAPVDPSNFTFSILFPGSRTQGILRSATVRFSDHAVKVGTHKFTHHAPIYATRIDSIQALKAENSLVSPVPLWMSLTITLLAEPLLSGYGSGEYVYDTATEVWRLQDPDNVVYNTVEEVRHHLAELNAILEPSKIRFNFVWVVGDGETVHGLNQFTVGYRFEYDEDEEVVVLPVNPAGVVRVTGTLVHPNGTGVEGATITVQNPRKFVTADGQVIPEISSTATSNVHGDWSIDVVANDVDDNGLGYTFKFEYDEMGEDVVVTYTRLTVPGDNPTITFPELLV